MFNIKTNNKLLQSPKRKLVLDKSLPKRRRVLKIKRKQRKTQKLKLRQKRKLKMQEKI